MKIKQTLKVTIWVALVVSVIISLVFPRSLLPDIIGLDKIMHFSAFFLITFFGFQTFYGKGKRTKIVLMILLFAVGLEYAQIYIPHREFSYNDMMMNVFGVIAGILISKIMK